MAANTLPIYPNKSNISWATLLTANIGFNGTGNNVFTIFTAGADGSRLDKVRIKHLGTNVQTVIQFFLNNGQTKETPSNNSLYGEKIVEANTISYTSSSSELEYDIDIALPIGYKLLVAITTTVASGIQVTAIGGDY